MREELPQGWAQAPLSDLLEPGGIFDGPFGSHLKTSDYAESGIRVLRLENLANLRFVEEKRTFISRHKYETLRKHTVVAGDILFGSFVDADVRVCLLPPLHTAAVAKADCFCIRTMEEAVDRRFLVYQLGTRSARDALLEAIHGVTRPRITTKQLRAFSVALAPLAEQRRIADSVDALLAQVDAARSHLAKAPLILKRFRQSVLAAACSGKLVEAVPEESPETSLGDLLSDARYGTSDRCSGRTTGSVPVLRVPNIASGRLDLTSLKFAVPQGNWGALMLQDGDVLICRTNGSLDLVGKAAVVANLPEPAAFASYLIRLRTDGQALLPRFLHLFLLSPSGRDQITSEARTTAGQFNLNLEILRGLRVALPPVDAQTEIIKQVDSLFSLADMIERRVSAASGRAEVLTQAILAKAFRGGLVPTEAALARIDGRDYESAAALLARIKSERAARASPTKQPSGTTRPGASS